MKSIYDQSDLIVQIRFENQKLTTKKIKSEKNSLDLRVTSYQVKKVFKQKKFKIKEGDWIDTISDQYRLELSTQEAAQQGTSKMPHFDRMPYFENNDVKEALLFLKKSYSSYAPFERIKDSGMLEMSHLPELEALMKESQD
tara:strand:- start:6778 stop:7200 length:423 start_codon:yes stop_codon:yes gene_type:complete